MNLRICLGLIVFFAMTTAVAQNQVVVIPMAGDDVAMAQQHFRYSESNNSIDTFASPMCESDVFNTPEQATQVAMVGNANARFSTGGAFWSLKIEFNKDSAGWINISPFTAYTEARTDSWSQLSTTDILDLDPNSSYQFRLLLIADGSTAFSTFSEYCELMITASYKLPADREILEIAPPVP